MFKSLLLFVVVEALALGGYKAARGVKTYTESKY